MANERFTGWENTPRNIYICICIWVFPKIVVPQIEWFIMEIPIKMDDLGVPLFSETSTGIYIYIQHIGVLLSSKLTWLANSHSSIQEICCPYLPSEFLEAY